jgi:exopolysaccharide biosynthesis polyprenyl glycosylphosphotransferase
MAHLRRTVLVDTFKLFDLVLFFSALLLAAATMLKVETHLSFSHFLSARIRVRNVLLCWALAMMWHLMFSLFGLYKSKRLSTARSECADVLKATTVASLMVAIVVLAFRSRGVDWLFLLSFWIYSSTVSITSRLVLRKVLAIVRCNSRNLRHLLIVGTNLRAIAFANQIETRPELGYRIIGFADDPWNDNSAFDATGYKRVCTLTGFPRFLASSVVDEVIIALPVASSYQRACRIVKLCEEQGIVVRFLPTLFDFNRMPPLPDSFEDVTLITLPNGAAAGWTAVVKRAVDCVLALGLVILLLPVLAITALLVKLTSRGPIVFVQKRVGLNKRVFSMYKFRTMVVDAEQKIEELVALNEVSGPVFKIKNDPRITRVGKFLRRTSIDELLQLFNVLKGDMSLVGPRPLPIRDYEGFSEDWQRRRFSVPPGITCLWQIKGRSSISFEQWMELDMQYIDKWSLQLDFEILARTIPAVLKGYGAA